MSPQFDPYVAWLDLPAPPLNYYELLRLPPAEPDAEAIARRAAEFIGRVRPYTVGAHSAVAAKLLDELVRASQCLGNPQRKQAYDLSLQAGPADALEIPLAVQPATGQQDLSALGLGNPLELSNPLDDVLAPAPPLQSAYAERWSKRPQAVKRKPEPASRRIEWTFAAVGGLLVLATVGWFALDRSQRASDTDTRRDVKNVKDERKGTVASAATEQKLPNAEQPAVEQPLHPAYGSSRQTGYGAPASGTSGSSPFPANNQLAVDPPRAGDEGIGASGNPTASSSAPATGNVPAAGTSPPGASPPFTSPATSTSTPAPAAARVVLRAIDLPELGSSGDAPQAVELARLASSLSHLKLVPPPHEKQLPWKFSLGAEAEAVGPWIVEATRKPGAQSALADAPPEELEVGRLWLDDAQALHFAWSEAARENESCNQLRNYVLEVASEGGKEAICLRQAERVSPYTLDLEFERTDLPLTVAWLPPADQLQVEILSHTGFPGGSNVVAASAKKKSDPLRLVVRAELPAIELHLRPLTNRNGAFIRVLPLALDGDGDSIPFTTERIKNMQVTLTREIAQSRGQLSSLESQRRGLQSAIASAQNIPDRAKRQLTVGKLTGDLKSVEQRGQSAMKRLARMEKQMSGLPGLITAGNQLHQQGKLHLRVFFQTGEHQVEVYRSQ